MGEQDIHTGDTGVFVVDLQADFTELKSGTLAVSGTDFQYVQDVETASGTYRIGWIGKTFFSKAIEKGLSGVKKHMQEESENLKRILEEG